MSTRWLPDWQRIIPAGDAVVLAPFEPGGNYMVLPNELGVAERPDGGPDLLLEMVRGENPALPPSPYGVLELGLRMRYPLDEALAAARAEDPRATIVRAAFSAGWLSLRPLGETDLPEELRRPVDLTWAGIEQARWILRMSASTAMVLRSAIIDGALPVRAVAELEVEAVAPRLRARVRFEPAGAVGALLPHADGDRRMARADLVTLLAKDPGALGFELSGTGSDPDDPLLAERLCDLVRLELASFVAAPADESGTYMQLVAPESTSTETREFDLSQPVAVPRPLMLTLDPLEAVRRAGPAGPASVIRETVVPALETGIVPVSVSANLPADREGVVMTAVNLRVEPKPPHRVHEVVETLELVPPADEASVRLRLAPGEPPTYRYQTIVVLRSGSGIRQFLGAELEGSGELLSLGPDDFPVSFVPIAASGELLALADLRCSVRWGEIEQHALLTRDHPSASITVAPDAATPELGVEARERGGTGVLTLGPLPAGPTSLGLHSFPAYGPHEVEVRCELPSGRAVAAVDLLPEGRPESAEEMTVLHFTRSGLAKRWSWLATSPFGGGYRFRPHPASGAVPDPWSDVRSPFEPLTFVPDPVP